MSTYSDKDYVSNVTQLDQLSQLDQLWQDWSEIVYECSICGMLRDDNNNCPSCSWDIDDDEDDEDEILIDEDELIFAY